MSLSLLKPNKIHFLIGENGVGKSLLLGKLSSEIAYQHPKESIIAIANTLQNKFPTLRIRNYFRLSSNKIRFAEDAILQAFIAYSKNRENHQIINLLRNTLSYIGYSEKMILSFKIKRQIDFKQLIYSMDYIKSVEDGEADKIYNFITNLIKKHDGRGSYKNDYVKVIHEIDLVDFIYDLNSESILTLLEHKYHLKKHKVVYDINIAISKDTDWLSLNDASSGELALLTTMAHISTYISHNAFILIDEPENSLHPRWQREYVNHLYNMFYQFEPKIILATHSPIVVSGAFESDLAPSIYEVKNAEIHRFREASTTNVEEILLEVFQLLTSENRFFSFKVNKIINEYISGEISYVEIKKQIDRLRQLSSDKNQIKIIDAIPNIIKKIVTKKGDIDE
ncbi:AAA family ATPase [Scandinavium goeteborgense]|uniref:AAA family ATPase n=1 Tax=Scandinavium goeteborgense TaxID=1851514 RepID=UPI00144861D0|nr:AAA family ATPase [Scandinavium goeteborgense]QKN82279.1 ATP-binding protein [Scandinavium goeteborgense]